MIVLISCDGQEYAVDVSLVTPDRLTFYATSVDYGGAVATGSTPQRAAMNFARAVVAHLTTGISLPTCDLPAGRERELRVEIDDGTLTLTARATADVIMDAKGRVLKDRGECQRGGQRRDDHP